MPHGTNPPIPLLCSGLVSVNDRTDVVQTLEDTGHDIATDYSTTQMRDILVLF